MLVPCDGVWTMNGGTCDWSQISSTEEAVLLNWGLSLQYYSVAIIVGSMITLMTYVSLGFLIVWRTGITRFGLIVSLALISIPFGSTSSATTPEQWTTIHPYFVYFAVLATVISFISQCSFLYLLPNGRFSPRWAVIPFAITTSLYMIGGVLDLNAPVLLIVFSFILLGIVLQIYRYFYTSTPVERQQTRWILVGLIAYVTSIILWIMVFGRALDIPAGEARVIANVVEWYIGEFLMWLFPISIAFAILRYKLWNIDIIINRTLVFGGLSALVVLLYTLVVGGMSVLFQSSNNVIISFAATALIALVFQPARDRLQKAVNQLMFGERDNPYAVLSQLGQQLQSTAMPSETLKAIVETIAKTLKLPSVAIELIDKDNIIGRAKTGKALADIKELPLRYQNELVGYLRVSPRAKDEAFTPKEEQLFTDIAAQIAPVASATRLTMALQQSRENLVLAREEERRRIRRDLHDGLGPTLASQTLQLDAILDMLIENDADTATEKVKNLKSQTQQMVMDIRRLVYELRPPALDELGLLEALRSHIVQMSGTKGLHIDLTAIPDPLPNLPAALEVAAYRIVLEAVTNVIRHAHAKACQVQFVVVEDEQLSTLTITVIDDGIGLPQQMKLGVGLTSMRERTSELGGNFEINSHQGTTHLTAKLPYVTKG